MLRIRTGELIAPELVVFWTSSSFHPVRIGLYYWVGLNAYEVVQIANGRFGDAGKQLMAEMKQKTSSATAAAPSSASANSMSAGITITAAQMAEFERLKKTLQ